MFLRLFSCSIVPSTCSILEHGRSMGPQNRHSTILETCDFHPSAKLILDRTEGLPLTPVEVTNTQPIRIEVEFVGEDPEPSDP